MAIFLVQDGVENIHPSSFGNNSQLLCHRIWDPVQARFEGCALPYIAAIPTIIATCLMLVFILQLLPWRPKFPLWTKNIIRESKDLDSDPNGNSHRKFTSSTVRLLILSVIGLALQSFDIFHPNFRIAGIFPAAAWATTCIVVVIQHPLHTPKALLVLHISLFATQCVVLADTAIRVRADDVPVLLGVLTSFGSIVIILNMPLRDPNLPAAEISPVFGPPISQLRSPEDNLTLWQYMTVSWIVPLMTVGSSRQLNDEDIWDLGYEFKHKHLSDRFRELEGSVLRRLVNANGIDLIFLTVLTLIQLFAALSTPLLLQRVLQSMENPLAPKSATITYAGIAFVIRYIGAQSSLFILWYGRRCYERSRGELITMLYEKTLARKVVSISATPETNGHDNSPANGNTKVHSQGAWQKIADAVIFPYRICCGGRKISHSPKKDALATTGKILNIMRFDAYEVSQRFWEFSSIIKTPVGLVASIVLIWKLMGWPSLIGAVIVVMAQVINAYIARILLRWEKDRRAATDVKMHQVSQLVESIRHLRWYGWQDVWIARIMESRKHELKLRVITTLWSTLIAVINVTAAGLLPLVAFYAYTVLAGLPLRIDVAFPAMQYFVMLDNRLRELPDLITVLLNAQVSIKRIDDFMNEPDKLDAADTHSSTDLEMNNASFAWPGASEPVLKDITLSFTAGLTVVFGQVGAGKSALLQALLGEADLLSGEYRRTNSMVGYCSQSPWLQSMSIRDNILFSTPYDSVRYRDVLEACALIPDMVNFKNGDLSLVGENGVGLSGGQKARIALARAVYSQSKILLLDDPLSALDHQTAETIVWRCINGPLAEGRTTILVTHRTELCRELANQLVEIHEGHAKVINLISTAGEPLTRVETTNSQKEHDKKDLMAIPDKFIEDEHRSHGGVRFSVYCEYIKAGKLKWWFILICTMGVHRSITISSTWFIKTWGEAYDRPFSPLSFTWFNPLSDLPHPENNIRPWLICFLLIAIARSLAVILYRCVAISIVYFSGKTLFENVMIRCTHTTFRFYDVTPVGRLMNRLTSDMNTVDGNISGQFQMIAMYGIMWGASIIVIASITPVFLVFAIALTLIFIYMFLQFLPASQSLRRLEMVSLTPLISNFGSLAEGLTTIRAFCAQYRFQERVIRVTDNFQKMDHFYWSLQAWLTFRFDALSASATFAMTALALYTDLSPGLTAFLLSSATQFVQSTHKLCKTYGQLQMDFVSVERVVEMLHLEQELPGTLDPPAYWPKLGGDIIFEDVTIRYAPHLDPALSNVSLEIKGGSTTALIGRTGSGKSTLALSMLATTLPSSGRILIDGIDIAKVKLQTLRQRVTFLAQEPVLFPGTMRQNLDPLAEFSSSDCESVLAKIAARHEWTLDTNIDTGGRNLSQGQRQLIGLARALLRRSAVIIMDEATASIDMETAMRIQEILREEMKESTVITIAHRVEAVKDADFCVELAKGRVLEVGEPGNMIAQMGE
ncbi:ABC transporter-like protein [Calycina marina]|uniref:ABC transporter-like protein n=1 Tax=Calycina marina TaxID=1763456 RepID=A0A9P7Z4P1_9HELO|nr:ABC transporter-like protein [Calycina marina]